MADNVQKIKKEIERIIEEETPISKGSDYYHGAKESMEKLLKFIDSLPKQEWSEEDERHRKRIVERLEDIRKSKEDNIDVASVILSEINWLKFIKPNHWKPS